MIKNKLPYGTGITFLTEVHINIAEWLRENRHLPVNKRIEEIAVMLCGHPDTDLGQILHYAASYFIALDSLTVHHEETLPAIIAEGTAKQLDIFGKYEQDRKTQLAKKGGLAKNKDNIKRAAEIRAMWATGKYTSRDICAEQEYNNLGYGSFKAARNALKNTPNPTGKE